MPTDPPEVPPPPGEARTLLSVNHAAHIANVSRKTIYRWIRDGILECIYLPSGFIRVYLDSLLRTPEAASRQGRGRPPKQPPVEGQPGGAGASGGSGEGSKAQARRRGARKSATRSAVLLVEDQEAIRAHVRIEDLSVGTAVKRAGRLPPRRQRGAV